MNRQHSFIFGLVFLYILCFQQVSVAADLLPEVFQRNGLVFEDDRFRGEWNGSKQWDGRICDGYYAYRVQVDGEVSSFNLSLEDDGSLTILVNLEDIGGRLEGFYRSKLSACLPLGSYLNYSVQWAELKTRVSVVESAGTIETDVKIDTEYTRMGGLHFDDLTLPAWFERFLTKVVNKAMEAVWATFLGDWIDDKIADYFEEILADPSPSFSPID